MFDIAGEIYDIWWTRSDMAQKSSRGLVSSCAGSLFLSVAPLLYLWECMFALFTPSVVGSGPSFSPLQSSIPVLINLPVDNPAIGLAAV